jgi:hypothetical protein
MEDFAKQSALIQRAAPRRLMRGPLGNRSVQLIGGLFVTLVAEAIDVNRGLLTFIIGMVV